MVGNCFQRRLPNKKVIHEVRLRFFAATRSSFARNDEVCALTTETAKYTQCIRNRFRTHWDGQGTISTLEFLLLVASLAAIRQQSVKDGSIASHCLGTDLPLSSEISRITDQQLRSFPNKDRECQERTQRVAAELRA